MQRPSPDGDHFTKALAAFRRVPSAEEPFFDFTEGYVAIQQGFDRTAISLDAYCELLDALMIARDALAPHAAALYDRIRVDLGIAALGTLLEAWASPFGSSARGRPEVEHDRLCVRIVANELDTVCAKLELARGSATRAPVPMAGASLSSARH